MKKLFRTENGILLQTFVKRIFLLSFYGERFALTTFLNRPTFCIETSGNVGCSSSEKYPTIYAFEWDLCFLPLPAHKMNIFMEPE